MSLIKIQNEDLIFENKCFEDRTNTELRLRDNSWMDYQLTTAFNTKNQGRLEVMFEYYGTVDSYMKVKRDVNGTIVKITYEYSTDIFEEHITRFMMKHLAAWKETYAFKGEELVLDFYNDVIEKGHVWEKTIIDQEPRE